jgi:hypothetical protein
MTLYTGARLNGSTELLVDIEEAGDAALSTGLGRRWRAGPGHCAPGAQYIVNPGYNRDRGPVFVGSFRAHVEL